MNGLARFETDPHEVGVFLCRRKYLGANAYYARLTNGEIVGAQIWIASDRETDAEICERLERSVEHDRALQRATRAHLRLLPRTVTASIDGPSHSHPEILDVGAELRAMLDQVRRDHPMLAPAVGEGLMPDVASRLERLLAQPA